jgi:histidyl-tRNA synthetase
MGFDRVMVSLGDSTAKKETVVSIACLPEGRKRALMVGRAFRDAGIRTETDLMERGLGAQLAHAAKSADFAIVIGKRETETGEVTIKDLHTGEQKTTSLEAAIAEVRSHGTR